MTFSIKIAVGIVLAAALLLGGYLLGRHAPSPAPAGPREKGPAPHSADDDGCVHPARQPLPPATPEDKIQAARTLESLPERIRSASKEGHFEELTALQQELSLNFVEGRLTGEEVLKIVRREEDPAVLDILVGALRADPSISSRPEIIRGFLDLVGTDPLPGRRHVALSFLGAIRDLDGSVRAALLTVARNDPDPNLRVASLVALREHVGRNPEAAGVVHPELLSLARTGTDTASRTMAISSIDVRTASEATIKETASYLQDAAPEIRAAAAEALADVRPASRPLAVAELDRALQREASPSLLSSLVRAGRSEALPALRRLAERDTPLRQEAREYVRILESGEVDWIRILEEKQKLEMSRPR